jgi:hypothetical protein
MTVASASTDVQVNFDIFDHSGESEVADFFSRAREKLNGRIEVLVNIASDLDSNVDDGCSVSILTKNFDASYDLKQKSVSLKHPT